MFPMVLKVEQQSWIIISKPHCIPRFDRSSMVQSIRTNEANCATAIVFPVNDAVRLFGDFSPMSCDILEDTLGDSQLSRMH